MERSLERNAPKFVVIDVQSGDYENSDDDFEKKADKGIYVLVECSPKSS